MVNDRHLQMAQSSGLSSTKHRVETDLEDKIALNLSTYCTGGSIREGPSLRLSLTLSKLIFLLQKKKMMNAFLRPDAMIVWNIIRVLTYEW